MPHLSQEHVSGGTDTVCDSRGSTRAGGRINNAERYLGLGSHQKRRPCTQGIPAPAAAVVAVVAAAVVVVVIVIVVVVIVAGVVGSAEI